MTIPVLRHTGSGYGAERTAERAAERPSDDELRDLVWVCAERAPRVGRHSGGGT
jgi:hypothetical protein